MTDKLNVAVVLEWHPFDVRHFYEMLWSMDDVAAYVQPWDIFVQDPARSSYDVVLYYNMSFPVPPADDARRLYVENELGSTTQGVVLLHHGVLSYETWQPWDEVSGTTDRGFKFHQGERIPTTVADRAHPITAGVSDFSLVDESYEMPEPAPDNHVLLTTNNPLSPHALAWTRTYGQSRVFCYLSGHDNSAWSSPEFRRILHQGLLWAAHRPK